MSTQSIIDCTAEFIRAKFLQEGSGHDWEHIKRVWITARTLAQSYPTVNLLVVELGALLHDVADWKFHHGSEEAGPQAARAWLTSLQVEENIQAQVEQIIREISFKGLGVETPMSSLEGAIVQDADRLDAIGAIGVGRAFAYGGHKNRVMHDPAIPPVAHDSFEAYKRNTAPTINHFYEKLLHLRDKMNTSAGRLLAEERHQFMEQFLAQFLREWDSLDIAAADVHPTE